MNYTWKCQKCFRYLSNIDLGSSPLATVTQRTICSRCKSENKITLTTKNVVVICGFSQKHESNLTDTPQNEAPDTKDIPVDKPGECLELDTTTMKKSISKKTAKRLED